MLSKFAVTHLGSLPNFRLIPSNHQSIKCCEKTSSAPSPPDNKFRFKFRGQSLKDNRWNFKDIDTNAVQETVNQWVSKTQHFLSEVTSPLTKTVQDRKPKPEATLDIQDFEDFFRSEQTVDGRMPNGNLSLSAIVSIEQFSRLNGLTGKKMQNIFKALVPRSVYNDARYLVEYCCFRFLSRDNSEIHPCLKDQAFRRLLFITMIAWENPYIEGKEYATSSSEKANLQRRLVREEAFVRIAPSISGVADWPTAHNLFNALAGEERGISFSIWSAYIDELLKVHEGRKSYQFEDAQFSGEKVLCRGSSRKQPVLKWDKNMAWPGKLTLTDKALYFEWAGLVGDQSAIRMDLFKHGLKVEKTRVGPLGSDIFDSAVSVSSGPIKWVLEFVDLGGEMRRDVWYAIISEVVALHKFVHEFEPQDSDESINRVYGAHKGKERATAYAINGIARLQALQSMRKLLDDPIKLVLFSDLQSAPYGHVVCQALAVNCWGGQMVTRVAAIGNKGVGNYHNNNPNAVSERKDHVFDIDGSVYLRNWMTSPSWTSKASVAFWKNSSERLGGVVLNKNLVVADMNLLEKSSVSWKNRCREVEKTQATIDAATLEGISSNIDLFKELVLPLTIIVNNVEKLRRWEEPHVTATFLAFTYIVIFRDMLSFIFPIMLMGFASGMLLLKGLREQGRLGRFFGKVTIRDQPPSNTIQKIIAVKEAIREVERFLQNVNVSLLKFRSIILAGHSQITTEAAAILLMGSAILLFVPFKYTLAFVVFDLFTRELEFRQQMVMRFMAILKERWDAIPALPVVVLPYKGNEGRAANNQLKEPDESINPESSWGSNI
ncbi:uncharacterized protein LOC124944688 [Impatiens glandulifera]|uniref:uncharacterized protein LOC124944688 n=1 Tax=Impatiens glandulifera TaxID=253017 RepID=UPI001FB13033|nr:uncharacterized protein LOC124944688 [Impatiens glandulifera]